ncbi:MAG: hypothetical protein JWR18_2467 [Segetibacter sp.]|nr:hypothetical protein [Segetibacter sp.]
MHMFMIKRMADPQGLYSYPDSKRFSDSVNSCLKYLSSLSNLGGSEVLMQQMVMPKSNQELKKYGAQQLH